MGGDDQGAAAASNAAAVPMEEGVTEEPQNIDLPLHSTIRTLQLQNGLRHSDYQRYRHYTTRRLRRLRKAVKATHQGKGKVFVAKPVTHEAIGGPENLKIEHLLLSLLNAERAWSFAMQLKQDAGAAVSGHTRSHLLRRLRKAAMWGKRLHEIVTHLGGDGRVTERTSLEVEAYSGWMASLLDLEQEKWKEALGKLKTAHSILSQLGEVGSLEDQDLFSNRAEELMQSMRYCQYNLGEGSSEALLDDLRNHHDHVPQALRDKLEAVLTTSRKAQASSLDHVSWKGVRDIPITSEDIRVAILKVKEAVTALEEEKEESKDAQYTQVYSAYEEALRGVQAEVSRLSGMSSGAKVEATKEDLVMLSSYLQYSKLEKMMDRNQALIARLLTLPSNQRSQGDLVHVYDALVQNAADMVKLPGVEDLDDILTPTLALQARFRAHRAFHLAEFHASNKTTPSLPEALVLYEFAGTLATQALDLTEDIKESKEKKAAVKDLENLRTLAAGGRHRTQALALLADLEEGTASSEKEANALTAAMAALTLSHQQELKATEEGDGGDLDKKKKKKAGAGSKRVSSSKRFLLERLEDLDGGSEADGFGIAAIPPKIEPIPAKPQFFDIAFKYLEDMMPDLSTKAGLEKTATTQRQGSLFGWLTG